MYRDPNMGDVAKEFATGPKTEIGKLKNAAHLVTSAYKNINPDSMIGQVVKYDNSTPEKTKKSLEAYHNFVSWVNNMSKRGLDEIAKLEGLISMMEINLAKAIEKLGEGKSLDDKDRKNMFFMRDTLVEISKIKYGEKHFNVTAELKDIRDMMFE